MESRLGSEGGQVSAGPAPILIWLRAPPSARTADRLLPAQPAFPDNRSVAVRRRRPPPQPPPSSSPAPARRPQFFLPWPPTRGCPATIAASSMRRQRERLRS